MTEPDGTVKNFQPQVKNSVMRILGKCQLGSLSKNCSPTSVLKGKSKAGAGFGHQSSSFKFPDQSSAKSYHALNSGTACHERGRHKSFRCTPKTPQTICCCVFSAVFYNSIFSSTSLMPRCSRPFPLMCWRVN